jgi:hypothetical protein
MTSTISNSNPPVAVSASTSLSRNRVAKPEGLAGALADQYLPAFVVTEELLAERAHRDQSVRTGTIEGSEQAKAG